MKKWTWAIAVILVSVGSPHAYGQPDADNKWHWIWVVPDEQKGWTTFEGDAPVSMEGRRFEVTLEGVSPDWQPSLKLVGTIDGKRVAATGVLLGTDASTEHYTGVIARVRTKLTDASHGWGSDRIVLQAGSTFIGLYRYVRSESALTPASARDRHTSSVIEHQALGAANRLAVCLADEAHKRDRKDADIRALAFQIQDLCSDERGNFLKLGKMAFPAMVGTGKFDDNALNRRKWAREAIQNERSEGSPEGRGPNSER